MTASPSIARSGLLRRWWCPLALVAAACLAIPAVIAAVFCQLYWGYVLAPPGMDRRVLRATTVLAHSTIRFVDDNSQEVTILQPQSVNFEMFAKRRDGDGAVRLVPPRLDVRRWREDWLTRGVVTGDPDLPAIGSDRCRSLLGLLESTGRLVRGLYGNGVPDRRAGMEVFELTGHDGERLLFIALATGELENDHLAYYEFLFDDAVSPPKLLDVRQWRFDVAGFEGFEFATVAAALAIPFLGVALPLTAGIQLYRRFSKRARIARGLCPACGYDLVGDFSTGCPECGRGRVPNQVPPSPSRR